MNAPTPLNIISSFSKQALHSLIGARHAPAFLRLAMTILLILAPLLAWSAKDAQYRASLKSISEEISSISRNLNANKALLKTEQDRLLESEQALAKANRQLKATRDKITAVAKQQEQLDQNLINAQQAQVVNRQALVQLLRSRYQDGQANYLKLLLNQENPYAVGRLNSYRQIMSTAFRQKAAAVTRSIENIADLKLQQTGLLQQLEFELQQQRALEKNIQQTKLERAASVAKLNSKVSQSTDKLKQLQQDRKRLNALLKQIKIKAEQLKRLEKERLEQERLQAKRAKERSDKERTVVAKKEISRPLVKGGFEKQKGRLSYPVDAKRVIKFGSRVAASGMRSEGVLFDTSGSVQVKSIFRGRVLFADFLKGYGLLIIVDHGDDHISLYGHNDTLLKSVGDSVETNEVISMSGVTGGLQKPGLYFEIRDNTTPVNPSKWCK